MAVFEVTDRAWEEPIYPYDDVPRARRPGDGDPQRAYAARAGWKDICSPGGTGCSTATRPSSISSIRWSTSTPNGSRSSREVPWRRPIASLNYLLTSHVWRQDHNGFSHQDPGFIDYVANKKADTVRVYFPPDANTLLCITDHCLQSWDRINVIVAGKQPEPQWLDHGRGDQALQPGHRHVGLGQQRPGRRARRGDGLLRRRPDARDPGGGGFASPRARPISRYGWSMWWI